MTSKRNSFIMLCESYLPLSNVVNLTQLDLGLQWEISRLKCLPTCVKLNEYSVGMRFADLVDNTYYLIFQNWAKVQQHCRKWTLV